MALPFSFQLHRFATHLDYSHYEEELEFMPIMQKGVAAFENRMPKVISPKEHAIADYITIGGLVLMGALFWKKNKRAAIAALTCAGAEAANTLLTDFPGGVAKVISFHTHGRIDMGLAATCSAMPNFMSFDDEPEAKYFRIMGLNITTVGALTDFREERPRRSKLRRIA